MASAASSGGKLVEGQNPQARGVRLQRGGHRGCVGQQIGLGWRPPKQRQSGQRAGIDGQRGLARLRRSQPEGQQIHGRDLVAQGGEAADRHIDALGQQGPARLGADPQIGLLGVGDHPGARLQRDPAQDGIGQIGRQRLRQNDAQRRRGGWRQGSPLSRVFRRGCSRLRRAVGRDGAEAGRISQLGGDLRQEGEAGLRRGASLQAPQDQACASQNQQDGQCPKAMQRGCSMSISCQALLCCRTLPQQALNAA
jgi:hypothetical protein